jgi:hypothetical protein
MEDGMPQAASPLMFAGSRICFAGSRICFAGSFVLKFIQESEKGWRIIVFVF